ncbi:glycosyltransferase [Nakamurella sp. YIM 132087]|uniref:Glycosyltransferase n=1 Tax=Nakamurella alba TaxID=2665158 RepID=A0A7K1FNW6_9ACTN|nr:glycosyltransferase family 2 protein [Nakamurella alba]MTD15845.1 glycosyltransferase [Nakamurella alba]
MRATPDPVSGRSQVTGRVSVVITHYRAQDELLACLDTIAGLPGAQHLEVVVADSDAEPHTAALVDEHLPGTRYVPFASNCGYAALVNAGLAVTDRPYVLVLNADIQVTDELLPRLVAHLDEHPDVGIVGPGVLGGDDHHQTTAFRFYRPSTIAYRRTPLGSRTGRGRAELERFEMVHEVSHARTHDVPLEADWLMGAAMLVRRSAAVEVGPMDESYFLYFEDVDWCLQFWQRGWRVHQLPGVQCRHLWSRASAKGGVAALLVNPLARRHLRSALKFFLRHGVSPSRPRIAAPVRPADRAVALPEQRSVDDDISARAAS